jgi:hypothetical protein
MSTSDLERELARRRHPSSGLPPSQAERLSVEDALAYKRRGNLPDAHGRSLRLVLEIDGDDRLKRLSELRSKYEPDYHEAPTWRRPGSKPINVVPLRATGLASNAPLPWWEDPAIAELEERWRATGEVHGVVVPQEFRGFVYKTALALRAAAKEVSVTSICDSIERWLPVEEAGRIRAVLERANGLDRD